MHEYIQGEALPETVTKLKRSIRNKRMPMDQGVVPPMMRVDFGLIERCKQELHGLRDEWEGLQATRRLHRSDTRLLWQTNTTLGGGGRCNMLWRPDLAPPGDVAQQLVDNFFAIGVSWFIGDSKLVDAPTLPKGDFPAIYELAEQVVRFYGLHDAYLALIQVVLETGGFVLDQHKDKPDWWQATSVTVYGGLMWCLGGVKVYVGPGQGWAVGDKDEHEGVMDYTTQHGHGPVPPGGRGALVFRFRRRPCLPEGSAAAAEGAPVAAAAEAAQEGPPVAAAAKPGPDTEPTDGTPGPYCKRCRNGPSSCDRCRPQKAPRPDPGGRAAPLVPVARCAVRGHTGRRHEPVLCPAESWGAVEPVHTRQCKPVMSNARDLDPPQKKNATKKKVRGGEGCV